MLHISAKETCVSAQKRPVYPRKRETFAGTYIVATLLEPRSSVRVERERGKEKRERENAEREKYRERERECACVREGEMEKERERV